MSFSKDIRLQRNVLIIGLGLMFIKIYAFQVTQSNAILSDALESLVNIAGGSFALFSLVIASRPSDKNHPYGHGKIEFISGFIEGTLIVVAGLMMIGKAAYNLVYPQEIQALALGILLTAFTGLVNFAMGYRLKITGKEKGSVIMTSEGTHLMSDGYTSLALIIGIGVVWLTDITMLDNFVAIFFGFYILYTGYKIFKTSVAGMMDEIDMSIVEELAVELNQQRKPEWIDVHNLRVLKFGRDIHIDCHLTLPWYRSLEESHEQVVLLEKLIQQKFAPQTEFFIHVDPCEENSCNLCLVKDCAHRKHAFVKKIKWDANNLLLNTKHDLDS